MDSRPIGTVKKAMKRLLDITAAAVLLAFFSPLGLIIVVILALTGEREIFFKQKRIGLRGRPFELLKFATMLKDSPNMKHGTLTVPDDPRVLPVGRFLRKTKLNEVPQLWNVLVGNMSLVGPRPLARSDFECYSPEIQRKVVEVQPGLTGLGSIVFRDEERVLAESRLPPLDCYRLEIAPRKGELEAWYIENQNTSLDLKLLLLTAVAVIAPGSRLHESVLPEVPRSSKTTTPTEI